MMCLWSSGTTLQFVSKVREPGVEHIHGLHRVWSNTHSCMGHYHYWVWSSTFMGMGRRRCRERQTDIHGKHLPHELMRDTG